MVALLKTITGKSNVFGCNKISDYNLYSEGELTSQYLVKISHTLHVQSQCY